MEKQAMSSALFIALSSFVALLAAYAALHSWRHDTNWYGRSFTIIGFGSVVLIFGLIMIKNLTDLDVLPLPSLNETRFTPDQRVIALTMFILWGAGSHCEALYSIAVHRITGKPFTYLGRLG